MKLWDSLLILKNIIRCLLFLYSLLIPIYKFVFYKKNYFKYYCSTYHNNINPWFIVGFVDAEGCFNINITKSNSNLIGYQVQARFIIELNVKDKYVLYKIQQFFQGIGSITITKNVARYSIFSLKDINKIITFFNEYPLQGSKYIDFTCWKECVYLMLNKQHLTSQGLKKILSYKNEMNFGESKKLKKLFPNIIPIKKPIFNLFNPELNPYWITGFIEGEGSFHINTNKNTNKMRPVFSIGLNQKDDKLLIRINKFFKEIGSIYKSNSNNSVELKVYKINNLNYLIEHLNNYPLQGFKSYNFTLWCDIVKLLENKVLTPEILYKINDLKNKLNKWK
uniref:hypothetical protein n=1 Tax=Gonatophragmium mori TaxID=2966219 RepID=UPI0023D8290D|nr:hypothetical protein P2Z26_mgp05 [Gonatophragmium mori]WCZ71175.1 hypothetical protein [Gonatophragmium mori]